MKKNVVIIITRLDLGGAQKVALSLFEKLDRKKFNVTLIAGKGGILDNEVKGIKGVLLWEEIKHPISPFYDLKAVLKLAKFIRENRTDIVNTHSSKAGILGRLAAALSGIKNVFHTVHGFSFHENQNPAAHFFYLMIERIVEPFTKKYIAVGNDVKNYGIKKGVGSENNYTVIRAAVNTSLFAEKRNVRKEFLEKFGLNPKKITVGMIGNLKKQKNPEEFVRIANLACFKDKNIQFIFAGGGGKKQTEKINKLIKEFGISERVKLAGWVEKPEEFMSSIDVFLLTSLWEGLPCTLVQAYCAGVPCVATDIAGNSEFLNYTDGGKLYPKGDIKAAVEYILKIKKRKIIPSKKILSEFDEKNMVKQYEKVFVKI